MMNIDDLKEAWKYDEPNDLTLPLSTEILRKTNSAISKVRRNMKVEFISYLISYLMLGLLIYNGVTSSIFFNITTIFIFILFVLNCFYFFRFYVFYKKIGRYDLNLRDSVGKLTYELELNIEIYKTYNMCITPFAVLIAFILLCGNNGLLFLKYILTQNIFMSPLTLLYVFITILISFLVTYILINIHTRQIYGKQLDNLKRINNDLLK